MTIRVSLPLFALFLAVLPACGDAADAGSAADEFGASGAKASGQAGSGSSGRNSRGGGPSMTVVGGASASAGYSGVTEGAGTTSYGTAPPPIWNSAKSATISEARLQGEYSSWKAAFVEPCANGSFVVVADGSVLSEGIAYGMLLSVSMADQPLFDGLWKYYQDHLDKNGLMNSRTAKCEVPGDNDSKAATDADLDATMALLQAAALWPNATTLYRAKAEALASKVAQFESDMCDGRRILRPGDAFGGCSDVNDPRINPSYFSPGYYKVFAQSFSAQSAAWTALSDASYQLYAIYQARMDNLVPDWSYPDGSDNGSQYSSEACRTPWRVAVDYAWTGDTRAKTFLQNISSWVDARGGLPDAAQQRNSAFIGGFALSGGYDQGKLDSYVTAWLETAPLDDTPYRQATLRVLYLLVAAGKFSSTL